MPMLGTELSPRKGRNIIFLCPTSREDPCLNFLTDKPVGLSRMPSMNSVW